MVEPGGPVMSPLGGITLNVYESAQADGRVVSPSAIKNAAVYFFMLASLRKYHLRAAKPEENTTEVLNRAVFADRQLSYRCRHIQGELDRKSTRLNSSH